VRKHRRPHDRDDSGALPELNLGDTAELSTDVGVIDRRVSTTSTKHISTSRSKLLMAQARAQILIQGAKPT
jgi:delta 1-pyrroline-5-carboxylate dehydrogenase